MSEIKLPFGAEFSPKQIDLSEVLILISSFEGASTEKFIDELDEKYFHNRGMANNCKN